MHVCTYSNAFFMEIPNNYHEIQQFLTFFTILDLSSARFPPRGKRYSRATCERQLICEYFIALSAYPNTGIKIGFHILELEEKNDEFKRCQTGNNMSLRSQNSHHFRKKMI